MADPERREPQVHADLRLIVNDLAATIVASGGQITVRTESAGRLMAEAARAAAVGPAGSLFEVVRGSGRVLAEAGLSARVMDRHGTVIQIGQNCRSRWGRFAPAGRHSRLGAPSAVLRAGVVYAAANSAVRARLAAGVSAIAGAAIAVLLVTGSRRRAEP